MYPVYLKLSEDIKKALVLGYFIGEVMVRSFCSSLSLILL